MANSYKTKMNKAFINLKHYPQNPPLKYLGLVKPWLQKGQAMVEFFSVMLVLIPLFWAIFTLGKFLDFDNAGRQATRYVNWEQTVGKTIANINNNNEVRERFLQSPLGGLDANILNQPLINPLWSMPALNRPNGDYFIVDPNRPTAINRNIIPALGLTTGAGVPGNQANNIQSVSVNIPLDALPWELSKYPDNAVIANAPNTMRYQAALLSNTSAPNTEQNIRFQLPAAQTQQSGDLIVLEPTLSLFVGFGLILDFFNLPLSSSYPYAEVWDYDPLTFFSTTPNSAILPNSRL